MRVYYESVSTLKINPLLPADALFPSPSDSRNADNPFYKLAALGPDNWPRIPFAIWLRDLLENPRLLRLEAGTPHKFQQYQNVLNLWKAAGFPRPREWNDAEYLQVSAYTQAWMDLHDKQGF
jgi:hypothetical protein